VREFWNTWKEEENCNIGCDGCIDCIGVLSCWKERWAEEVIGGKVGEAEKK
jgi:hypothetical protein